MAHTRALTATNFLFLILILFGFGGVTFSGESDIVYTPDGRPIFEFGYRDEDNQGNVIWDISDDEYSDIRQALIYGADYWAEVLGPGLKNTEPAPIIVYGDHRLNASAASPQSDEPGLTNYTALGAMLIKGWQPDEDEAVGIIEIGNWWPYFGATGRDDPSFYYNGPITHLPENGDQMHLASTMLHELAHALGVGSTAYNNQFAPVLTLWDQNLRDANGNSAQPGQRISNVNTPGSFYVPDGTNITFAGKNVMEVLDGAMPAGIPIWGWESGTAEFSHIELRNSMMSHGQAFQNYATFMEAELAVMQDLGYQIDRKKYYGRSIYNDNVTILNEMGFNSDGMAGVGLHVYGTGNTVTQLANIDSRGAGGIGIRVDGWENRMAIASGVSIKATGAGGIGIAFAYGRNHTLNHRGSITAAERGLSFDFGSNAMGDYFSTRGSWINMEVQSARRAAVSENAEWSLGASGYDETNGALADKVDISGSIDAPQAIYIAENAYVKEINILNGASLNGNIVSDWRRDKTVKDPDPFDQTFMKYFQTPDDPTSGMYGDYGTRWDLFTSLTFGKAMDAAGNSLAEADPNFYLRYDGDIDGRYSMKMDIVGGELEYNGTARLMNVKNSGILSGSGTYEIEYAPLILPSWDASGVFNGDRGVQGGEFNNFNTLMPGGGGIGDMTIRLGGREVEFADGHVSTSPFGAFFYSTGTLAFNFNAAGEHSSLKIEGSGELNTVSISNQRVLKPLAEFYESGKSIIIRDDDLVAVSDVDDYNDTSSISVVNDSHTLKFSLSSAARVNTITTSRAANAYDSLLAPTTPSGVGNELDRILGLGIPSDDLRRVYAALDFGDAATAEAAGRSLTPVFQQSVATALAQNQFSFNNALFQNHDNQGVWIETAESRSHSANANLPACQEYKKEGLFFFFAPSGGGGSQSSKGWENPGYSFWQAGGVLGVERHKQGGMYGAHLVANHLRLDGRDSSDKLKSTGVYLGVHGRLDPSSWNGGYLFGSARAGVDIAKQEREVLVGGYRGINKSDWNGFAASALAGAGYDFHYNRVSFGPVASLEYALSHRPSYTETEGLGNLSFQAKTYNSLRSNLGARASWKLAEKCSLSASAAWTHELLDKMATVNAGFAGYGNSGITYKAKTAGRDSLTAGLGLTFAVTHDVSVTVEGGAELFKNGYNSGWGGFTLTKAF